MRSAVKILFLTPLYVPHVGGLETLVREVAGAFRSRGHTAAIVTSHGRESSSGDDLLDGVPVRRVDAHDVVEARDATGILRVELEILRFARAFEPDIVHSHDAGPVLWMYTRVARRDRRPLIVTLHNVMTRKFGAVLPVLAKMLREADWVTGVSQAVADDVLEYEPSVASRMSVIANGVASSMLDASAVPDGPPRLLCMGRLDHQKGFDLAISALARLREPYPNVRLVVAGDGPERDHLIASCARSALTTVSTSSGRSVESTSLRCSARARRSSCRHASRVCRSSRSKRPGPVDPSWRPSHLVSPTRSCPVRPQ